MLSFKSSRYPNVIRIQNIHFVFVFENIWICIRIQVKMRWKVLSESDYMCIQSVYGKISTSYCSFLSFLVRKFSNRI
jgi:hypothetical protein